jgi:hypothetical protein
MVLGYSAAILVVKNDNETGDRKVTDVMYKLCLAEILMLIIAFIYTIFKMNTACRGNITCTVTAAITFLVAFSLTWGLSIGYDALIISRYKNKEELNDKDLVFSKVYIVIFTIFIYIMMKKRLTN